MSFAGLNCVITGASSGIGRAVTTALAQSGARLWVIGRSRARLEQALCAAAGSAQAMTAHECDLEIGDEVAALAGRLLEEMGGVDILVHCAGVISLGGVGTVPAEDFDRQYQVNLRAPFLLTQALLPLLRKSRGQVVFLNSTAGLRANANAAQYSATKHGLKALADSLRDEVNKDGVRVLSIYSGRTNSPMQRAITEWENKPWMPESLMQPEDVAAALLHSLALPRTAEITDLSLRPFLRYPQ